MKGLTGTLLAAQKKARAKPYVAVLIQDKLGANQRLSWSQCYTDAVDDRPMAMCIAGDNSIVRAYSEGAGNLYSQRVTDPTVEAQWNTWSDRSAQCSHMNQIYLVAQNSGTYVWLFYISRSDLILYCKESSDYGASWGGSVTVKTNAAGSPLESVCAAVSSGTDLICFYSSGVAGAYDVRLWRKKRTAGAWGGAGVSGSVPVWKVRGLTCHKTDDYNLIYGAEQAGTEFGFETPVPRVWCLYKTVYGNGVNVAADTWATAEVIERTDAGTSFASAWPSLTYVDMYRALFTGYLVGEDYSRVVRMRGIYGDEFMNTEWTDPFPFKAEGGPFGMVTAYRVNGDGYVYACCSNAAYRAAAAGHAQVDVSSRVVKYKAVDRWTGHKASGVSVDYGQLIAPEIFAEIWLDNSDGGLNTLGTGSFAAFTRGAMVVLRRGYEGTIGNEYSPWPSVWLEDYEYVVDFRGKSYLVLYCIGPWAQFSGMAAQRQYHWVDDEATVAAIAQRVFALAGFRLTDGGEASAEISSLKPSIVIHPGQDLRGAALTVLSKVSDFVYWEGSTAYLKELASDEASDYTYGGAGEHVIISGRYGVRSPAYDHIEVFSALSATGIPTFGDEVDYAEVDLVGHRLQKVFDYAYDTDAECDTRAVSQLRKHDASKKRGELVTIPNVGLQLLDVVTVTDSRAGISAEIYRVRGIEETYDTTKPPLVYRQRVTLGGR